MRVFTRWDEQSSSKETNEFLTELALHHAALIEDTAIRERYTANIVSGNFPDLCDFDLAYEELTVGDATHCRQINAFFSKRADLDIGFNRRQLALEKFKESEDLCRETNHIIELRRRSMFTYMPRVESVLYSAQRKISSILGDVPPLSDLKIRFGPGATTQVKRKNASARLKLSQVHACSEEMLPRIREYLEELQGWIFSDESPDSLMVPVEIHHGKLVFVPKTCKIDRPVVVEPSLNTMFQSGIGTYIKGRLHKFGVDITDQTRNQRLACEGSLTGALATLDLSSASDTIAKELVYDLFPIDWAMFLNGFRSSTVTYEGFAVRLQKFSSMGNGFTFPLETLIFYSLAVSCVDDQDRHLVSVYGDDIIVPVYAYALLIEVLTAVGFIANRDKSFSTGPFRESCGADYLKGINIRPCYIKGPLAGFDVFRLHNFYVRRGYTELASVVVQIISPHLRRWGPDGYGDGHLLGDHLLQPHGRRRGWSGYTFETYSFRSRKSFTALPGDRVYPSYCIYASGSESESDRHLPISESDILARLTRLFHLESEVPSFSNYDRSGLLWNSVPGRKGYNLIKIYTLKRT